MYGSSTVPPYVYTSERSAARLAAGRLAAAALLPRRRRAARHEDGDHRVVHGTLLVVRDEERERRRDAGDAGAQHELRALHVDGGQAKATRSSSFFLDFLAVEMHCDAMASAQQQAGTRRYGALRH